MNKKLNILIIICLALLILTGIYFLGFKMISHDRRENLIILNELSGAEIRKNVTLRFSKGWQIRNECEGTISNKQESKIKVSIKNLDSTPLMVTMQLDENSISALSKNEDNFKKNIHSQHQEVVYYGKLSGFIGKVIKIRNDQYLTTSFELIIESEEKQKLEFPIHIFAYIPTQTI